MRISKLIISCLICCAVLVGCNGNSDVSSDKESSTPVQATENTENVLYKSVEFKKTTVQDFVDLGNTITRITNYNLDDLYFMAKSNDGDKYYSFIISDYLEDESVDLYMSDDEDEIYTDYMDFTIDDVKEIDIKDLKLEEKKGQSFKDILDLGFHITYVMLNEGETVQNNGVEIKLDKFDFTYIITFKNKDTISLLRTYQDGDYRELEKELSSFIVKDIINDKGV